MASAMFSDGNLPMSSDEMPSETRTSLRFTSSAVARLLRKAVTTTSSTAAWSAAGAGVDWASAASAKQAPLNSAITKALRRPAVAVVLVLVIFCIPP